MEQGIWSHRQARAGARPLCVLSLCGFAACCSAPLAQLQSSGASGSLFSFLQNRRRETSDLAWQDTSGRGEVTKEAGSLESPR